MSEEKNAFCGTLSEASVIQKDADRSNIVYLSFQEGIKGKITFLEESIFRYDVSTDGAFPEYAAPRDEAHTAKIQQYPDEADAYTKPEAEILEDTSSVTVQCGRTRIVFDKRKR